MSGVFLTFLQLGLTSFGGPIAHLGYFRREFVERRRWLDEASFAHLVALCSVLPGPTSSQVGMLIGLVRSGPGGAVAAWVGFTLPAALALAAFAALLTAAENGPGGGAPKWLAGGLAGLAAAATGIVAQAVLGMAATLCTDRVTRSIAAGAAGIALALAAAPGWQWLPIAAGAAAGALFCRDAALPPAPALPFALPRAVSVGAGVTFVLLASAATFAAQASPAGRLIATIVRAGSLVFGGGHVVLPLLHGLVPAGLVSERNFFAGYGAAQGVPGPLFTFATFLGMENRSALSGPAGALAATVLIFLPSFLLVFALVPLLDAVRTHAATRGMLRGANASVVGLLGAVWYSPLMLSLGSSTPRALIALAVFALVAVWKAPAWLAVALAAAVGAAGSFA